MLGASDRIGEALALRRCDIDDSRAGNHLPMGVTVAGTLVVIKRKGVFRQEHPKTSNSRRTLEVPEFTAEGIRRRLERIENVRRPLLFFPTTACRWHRITSDAASERCSPKLA